MDTSNNGKRGTMPWHIWQDEVILAAIRTGASREGINACKHKLARMYQAGEPVYMAAHALKQFARGWVLAGRGDREARHLQSIIHRANALSRPEDFSHMWKRSKDQSLPPSKSSAQPVPYLPSLGGGRKAHRLETALAADALRMTRRPVPTVLTGQ